MEEKDGEFLDSCINEFLRLRVEHQNAMRRHGPVGKAFGGWKAAQGIDKAKPGQVEAFSAGWEAARVFLKELLDRDPTTLLDGKDKRIRELEAQCQRQAQQLTVNSAKSARLKKLLEAKLPPEIIRGREVILHIPGYEGMHGTIMSVHCEEGDSGRVTVLIPNPEAGRAVWVPAAMGEFEVVLPKPSAETNAGSR